MRIALKSSIRHQKTSRSKNCTNSVVCGWRRTARSKRTGELRWSLRVPAAVVALGDVQNDPKAGSSLEGPLPVSRDVLCVQCASQQGCEGNDTHQHSLHCDLLFSDVFEALESCHLCLEYLRNHSSMGYKSSSIGKRAQFVMNKLAQNSFEMHPMQTAVGRGSLELCRL